MLKNLTLNYLTDLKACIDEIDLDDVKRVIEILYDSYSSGQKIFLMGNGGSASTASHFACDLAKGTIVDGKKRLKVFTLNDNSAMVSALANDYGYEEIFIEQLRNLLNPDDVVIAITASGNSPNILKAVEYAKIHQAVTIGFIGFGGGRLSEMVDEQITVSSCNYGNVEDIHLILAHTISQSIKELILNPADGSSFKSVQKKISLLPSQGGHHV